jgi:hypothetical protein
VTFSVDEWDLLVRLPRWLVAAASAAQADSAPRTRSEVEAGFVAIASGRELPSALVRSAAEACLAVFDEDAGGATAAGIVFSDRDEDLAIVLDRIRAAAEVLKAKAEPEDAAAYLRWLVAVTDMVIRAARSGDTLGIGGDLISSAERQFRDRVVLATQA